MFTLWFVNGDLAGPHVLREGDTLIGRAPACDVVLNTPSVSRQHARVRVAGTLVLC